MSETTSRSPSLSIATWRPESDERVAAFRQLCGEMLATLEVNLDRETLTSQDDVELRRFIEAWRKRMMEI
jgi:hypothetical protein